MADKTTTFVTPISRYHPRYILYTRDTNTNTFQPGPGAEGNSFRQIPDDVNNRLTNNGGGNRKIPDLTF